MATKYPSASLQWNLGGDFLIKIHRTVPVLSIEISSKRKNFCSLLKSFDGVFVFVQFDFSGSTKDENTKKTSVSVKRKLLEVESDDEEDTKSCKVPKSLLKLKFPEIFKCQCIYLSSSLPEDEAENLKRHIEAFGGKVLSKKESENEIHLSLVTHCVGEKDSVFDQISKAKMKTLSKVTHISLPTVYVWKCIANKSKLWRRKSTR